MLAGLVAVTVSAVHLRWSADARQAPDMEPDWPMGMDAHVPDDFAKHVTRVKP